MTTIKSDIHECGNCHLIFGIPASCVENVSCPVCKNENPTCAASGRIVIEAEH